ncbi:hypothetical protein PG985_012223 [Apiospora marii]|uniref:uncharacterized protein n=1 Tax=Apiospora marii TaxID=335849 RepID=UPI00312F902A
MASPGLSKLPTEVLAGVLGPLDSSEDLRACLHASPIMWHSYMWKPRTILSEVACRSIGYDCLKDALAIIRFPELSTGMSRDQLRFQIAYYLLNRVIMRFVGDLVRKARGPDRMDALVRLPSWAHPSFPQGLPHDTEWLDLSKAELTRYKLAFLRHEIFHLLCVRITSAGLFSVHEQSILLFERLEEHEIVGLGAVHLYLRRLHVYMLSTLENVTQQALCKASQRYVRTHPEPTSDVKASITDIEQQPPTDMISLDKIVRDLFPHLDELTRNYQIKTMAEQDIVTIYKRIRSGPERFRNDLKAQPPRYGLPGIDAVCTIRIVRLWQSTIRTPSRTFPGPTKSWTAGLRPRDYIYIHHLIGIPVSVGSYKYLPSLFFAVRGWAFLDNCNMSSIQPVRDFEGLRTAINTLRRQHEEIQKSFIAKFDGLYITKSDLESFQQRYGITSNQR